MAENPSSYVHAMPLENNLFEWHFTLQGPEDTDFHNGLYHGRIILPAEYPVKPPEIIFLTPSGRFETNVKVCLSISGYHPESWQPSWSIRTALLAVVGFMPTSTPGAIGSLDFPPKEKKRLAKLSRNWKCSACGKSNSEIMLEVERTETKKNDEKDEVKRLASQLVFSKPVEGSSKSESEVANKAKENSALVAEAEKPKEKENSERTNSEFLRQRQKEIIEQKRKVQNERLLSMQAVPSNTEVSEHHNGYGLGVCFGAGVMMLGFLLIRRLLIFLDSDDPMM